MRTGTVWVAVCFLLSCAAFPAAAQNQNALQPRVVDPGKPGEPPSDAIVLFDGKDLSAPVSIPAPLMLEHLKTATEYEEGKQYILRVGRETGVQFV